MRHLPDSRRGFQPGDRVLIRYGGHVGFQKGVVLGHTAGGKLVIDKVLANSGRTVRVRLWPREVYGLDPEGLKQ